MRLRPDPRRDNPQWGGGGGRPSAAEGGEEVIGNDDEGEVPFPFVSISEEKDGASSSGILLGSSSWNMYELWAGDAKGPLIELRRRRLGCVGA